jgi:hypothetical protein
MIQRVDRASGRDALGKALPTDGVGVMGSLRVFVSYSGEDHDLVEQIVTVLKKNGLKPMWMGEFQYINFHDEIRRRIAHAHVFVPIITPASSSRGWVHEEIGYALALNIPFFCIAKGELPGNMIQQLNAFVLDKDSDVQTDIERLQPRLTRALLEEVSARWNDRRYALYACADDAPQRAQMMADYADDVRSLGGLGLVRQKGALSSFHIPDKSIDHAIWRLRYGGFDRGDSHCTHQWNERVALEKHAREKGCKIIIDPSIKYEQWGANARRVRLQTLLDFLETTVAGKKTQIAINTRMSKGQSLTIVGDWFAAESVSGTIQGGYKQTIFTRHAPSVASRASAFDKEFDELLAEAKWSAKTSRASAIEVLRATIAEIDEELSAP